MHAAFSVQPEKPQVQAQSEMGHNKEAACIVQAEKNHGVRLRMVSPLLIIAVIGLIITAVFGASEIFKFKGQPSVADSIFGAKKIPIGNSTVEIPSANQAFDFGEWMGELPAGDIINTITSGITGFVSWVAKGIVGLLNIAISKFGIPIVLPPWFGILLVIFLLGTLFAHSVVQFSDAGYRVYIYMLVFLGVFMIIGIAFFYLKII